MSKMLITVRFDPADVRRVDRLVERERKLRPGLGYTRADFIRVAVLKEIDSQIAAAAEATHGS